MKILRDYQENAALDIAGRSGSTLVCLPTGSGKTVIAAAVIELLKETVVFVVPRIELIRQAREEFGDTDVLWSDRTEITGKHCIVASKDTLRTRYKSVPAGCVLIFDEAHIGLELTHSLVSLIKPVRTIGFTATPERMDGLALLKGSGPGHKFGVFDELLQAESVFSLIKKKYLVPLKYYTRPIEGITDIKAKTATGEELSDEQMTAIFDRNAVWGDMVESYKRFGSGRPALGFTSTVAMAEKVAGIFRDAGYKFEVIHGKMSDSERYSLIQQLRGGELDGLVNAALLTYGFDCPPVSYAFSCRHIKSRPLWFQMVGRILRPFEGKADAVFVDHGDSISEFSEPDCPLPITSPVIKWRADGETREEKAERKKQQKRVQDSMKILQQFDPLPADMVEVTSENAWDRLIRILQKLSGENSELSRALKIMREQAELKVREAAEAAKTAAAAEKKAAELEKKIRDSKIPAARYVDSDRTFEFCKKNYCLYRRSIAAGCLSDIQALPPEERGAEIHRRTVAELRKALENYDFLPDEMTFTHSMNYWLNNYRDVYQGRRSNT